MTPNQVAPDDTRSNRNQKTYGYGHYRKHGKRVSEVLSDRRTRALLRLERTMNLLEGGKGGWGREGGEGTEGVGREGGERTWGREGG